MTKMLIGGTHGNEWTGVYILDYFNELGGFDKTLLANPEAVKKNQRYCEEDLNRCFNPSGGADNLERRRAKEILKEIESFDLLVDCHTTTSNMGTTVIFCRKSPEVFNALSYIKEMIPDALLLYNPDPESKYMISHAPIGLVIEVGPVANSTLNPHVFEETKNVVQALLDWDGKKSIFDSLEYFKYEKTIPYSYENNKLVTMVHPDLQDSDFVKLNGDEALLVDLAGKEIFFENTKGLFPIFVNEAAYYKYEYAMQLVSKQSWKRISS